MPTLTIKSDKPMMLVSVEEYESMQETIDILSSPALVADIRQGLKDIAESKTYNLSDLRAARKQRN